MLIENCAHPDYRQQLRDYVRMAGHTHTPQTLAAAFGMHIKFGRDGDMRGVGLVEVRLISRFRGSLELPWKRGSGGGGVAPSPPSSLSDSSPRTPGRWTAGRGRGRDLKTTVPPGKAACHAEREGRDESQFLPLGIDEPGTALA